MNYITIKLGKIRKNNLHSGILHPPKLYTTYEGRIKRISVFHISKEFFCTCIFSRSYKKEKGRKRERKEEEEEEGEEQKEKRKCVVNHERRIHSNIQ